MFNSAQAGGSPPKMPNITRGFATVGGIVAAWYGTPLVVVATKSSILEFGFEHYGRFLADVSLWGWWAVVACACFFGARMALSDGMQALRMFIGSKFF